ncbi:MAG: bifunctional adenosylcobinamide kinase/adenosylcobinamide-phosphate guanylyltransferase, partial [Bauldia sp.]
VYIATAEAGDGEMAARVADHRQRRGSGWRTVEEPLALPATLAAEAGEGRAVLVDCLTLWLSNLMAAGRDIDVETDALIAALTAAAGPVVIVANEVGSGIMPANALARRFADAHGILNQRVAATVGRHQHDAAGLPVSIKPAPEFAL